MCQDCKQVKELNEIKLKRVRDSLYTIMDKTEVDNLVFYEGAGCEKCNSSGYKGRIGIHEVLIMDTYLEEMILRDASANEMTIEARKHGMITILQDALIKAALGLTTVDEALKLI